MSERERDRERTIENGRKTAQVGEKVKSFCAAAAQQYFLPSHAPCTPTPPFPFFKQAPINALLLRRVRQLKIVELKKRFSLFQHSTRADEEEAEEEAEEEKEEATRVQLRRVPCSIFAFIQIAIHCYSFSFIQYASFRFTLKLARGKVRN